MAQNGLGVASRPKRLSEKNRLSQTVKGHLVQEIVRFILPKHNVRSCAIGHPDAFNGVFNTRVSSKAKSEFHAREPDEFIEAVVMLYVDFVQVVFPRENKVVSLARQKCPHGLSSRTAVPKPGDNADLC